MTFRVALLAMAGVYLVNLAALPLGIYAAWTSFDVPMHALGGFVAGMLGIAVHHALTDKHHFQRTPFWYHILFVTSFVVLVAVAWEFHEYLIDNTLGAWYGWRPTQPSIGDTMLDLLMGAVGAVVSVFAFKSKL